jgi:MOSC domain-containing protein YiiM
MTEPRLLSIQVGMPAIRNQEQRWRTAFFKSPVDGPVWLGHTNLAGDGQANRKVHGGPDKAVLAYAGAHYPLWRAELEMPDLPHGAFAENLTVSELHEDTVCLGDVYAIGEARLQVSQPRQPCSNITRRWDIRGLTQKVEATGRTGWYLRVLTEAFIEAGMELQLLERPAPDWSIVRATSAMQRLDVDREEAARLAGVPSLSVAWRDGLRAALDAVRT